MGARELLADLTSAGFTIEADTDHLVIRPASKLTDDLRTALRQAKPDLLALLTATPRPHRLSQPEADVAHAEPWSEADISRFTQRVVLFLRRGVNATDADDLAERLRLRDLQGDDRRLCLECRHLAGWRCGNYVAAGVGRDLPQALAMQLQRCPGFEP